MSRRALAFSLLASAAALAGCATSNPDPLETWNRGLFWFNEKADRFVLEPAATGWDFAVPETAQKGVSNFFDNLGMPVVFANDLLQGKPRAAGQDLARFAVNTVVGVAGLFDVASRIEIPAHDEDFGQTLGRWGLAPGPYLVLPLLGPSNPRDAVGSAADTLLNPVFWVRPNWLRLSLGGVNLINRRAALLEEIRESRESAFDYYVFVRDAYLQNRERRVADGTAPSLEEEEELYYPDDDGR